MNQHRKLISSSIVIIACLSSLVISQDAQQESESTESVEVAQVQSNSSSVELVATSPPPLVPSDASAAPNVLTFNTPYSIRDCIDIVDRATEMLRTTQGSLGGVEVASIYNALDAVVDYLEERDDLQSTLSDYSWEEIGRDQVRINSEEKSFIWRENEIPKDVTAISFEVERADVVLKSVKVFDDQNQLVGPYSKEVTLRHSLPRRYVYHLYQPTNIQTLRFEATQVNPEANRTPQIILRAGRAEKIEHGKLGIYYILLAENQLREANKPVALETLAKAREEIRLYRLQVRSL